MQPLLKWLRNTHGDWEGDFKRENGCGFDGLTASEASHLAHSRPADTVRDRILAAAQEGSDRSDQGNLGFQEELKQSPRRLTETAAIHPTQIK